MTEQPPSQTPESEQLAQQLARTAADLRTLAEQLGAIPPGPAKVYSLRRARVTFAVVVAVASLAGWFIWSHWHSLWVALAPLVWIFGHGWRLHRNVPVAPTANDAQRMSSPPGGGDAADRAAD
jgi:hypothetical protein